MWMWFCTWWFALGIAASWPSSPARDQSSTAWALSSHCNLTDRWDAQRLAHIRSSFSGCLGIVWEKGVSYECLDTFFGRAFALKCICTANAVVINVLKNILFVLFLHVLHWFEVLLLLSSKVVILFRSICIIICFIHFQARVVEGASNKLFPNVTRCPEDILSDLVSTCQMRC